MRILSVTWSWPAETFINRHIFALYESRTVELIVASYSPAKATGASVEDIDTSAIPAIQLPNFNHFNVLQKIEHALRSQQTHTSRHFRPRDRALLRAIEIQTPDIIHFQFGRLAVKFAWLAKELKVPYTVSLRGSDIQVFPLVDSDYKRQLETVLAEAGGIHTVCDVFAEQARRISQNCAPTTTIRTCVPIPEMTKSPSLIGDCLRFVTVGRLHWRKALDDVIRAISYLPNTHLEIIGEGPDRDYLTFLAHNLRIQDRIQFSGQLTYQDFQSRLLKADAYVQSSVAEGFSNALAEAMALGMPVFATPAGGTTEILKDGINGIVIPMGEPKQQAEQLKLAEDAERMMILGKAARETAQQQFNAEKHTQEFALFFNLAAQP